MVSWYLNGIMVSQGIVFVLQQYQDAIRDHKKGKPLNYDELPCPPGILLSMCRDHKSYFCFRKVWLSLFVVPICALYIELLKDC